jgi:hypothetical protein
MINIDALNDDEKLAALESIHKSIAESKEIQKKKITTNVEMILKALKKIEGDLKQRYDETGKLIANLKNGTDGRDGKDGKEGRAGLNGRDGAMGPRGYDGLPGRNGLDGEDGVSITDAHIDFDGSLIISLSTGRVINVGEVVTADIAERIKVITNGGGTSQYVLDTLASLQAQISAISSGLNYQGTWNASTNVPTLTSSVGVAGYYYIVATAGSTNLNGVTDWQVGDWAIFNGSVWQKLDQTNLVTSVAGRTGAIVLTTSDIGGLGTIATQASSNVSITGGSITGITDLAIADGGTGQSTAAAAITALTGTQTSGYYLRSNGTGAFMSAIQAADVPTLNQSTTGSAATLSLTNPVSRGGTNLTSLTNKGVLYASSTNQVATGTGLQFDGTNLGVGVTPSSWGSIHRSIEFGALGSLVYFVNGSIKKTSLSTNSYNATNTGAAPYYKENGLATEYTQNVGVHTWAVAPTGIAGPTTGITTGRTYTNVTAGNQPDFGAVDGLVGTIWVATSSGTLTTGTVVQNIEFVESMRIDASSNVGIGITNPGSRLDVKGTLRLSGSTSGYVGLSPAAAAGSTTYILPSADGTAGQALTTNGSGTLSWGSTATGTVTSVAATVPTFLSIAGSPVTTSGTLAITLSGTALPTTSGGTGLTSFTANGVVYASSTSALATGSALTFDGTTLGLTGALSITTSVGQLVRISDSTGASGYNSISLNGNDTFASGMGLHGASGGDTTLYYTVATGGNHQFRINNAEQMRLTSTGLGIGTSSPTQKLSVNSGASTTIAGFTSTGSSAFLALTNSGATTFIGNDSTSGSFIIQTPASSFSTKLTLDNTGNLGLGVTPSAWNSVIKAIQIGRVGNGIYGQTNNNTTNITSNAYFDSVSWKYGVTDTASYYSQFAGAHTWFNAPSGTAGNAITFTQAMTLAASGGLSVGLTTDAGAGNINISGTYKSNGVDLIASDGSSNYLKIGATLYIQSGSTTRAVIDSSGNLLVGTTTNTNTSKIFVRTTSSNPAFASQGATGDLANPTAIFGKFDNDTTTSQIFVRFTVNNNSAGSGQINANGANTAAFGSYSDIRLKENIVDLPSQLTNIMALRPVEFDYIESEGGGHQTGFVAQNMESVYPDVVGERSDGMKTITGWSKTEARLVKAIQEQQAIIESLKARLDAANL